MIVSDLSRLTIITYADDSHYHFTCYRLKSRQNTVPQLLTLLISSNSSRYYFYIKLIEREAGAVMSNWDELIVSIILLCDFLAAYMHVKTHSRPLDTIIRSLLMNNHEQRKKYKLGLHGPRESELAKYLVYSE